MLQYYKSIAEWELDILTSMHVISHLTAEFPV